MVHLLQFSFCFYSHDGEELSPVEYCTGDGCFEKKFVYESSDEQIDALKTISNTCYQGHYYLHDISYFQIYHIEISYGCKMAPLKNSKFGHYFGWWTGKDGMLQTVK